MLLKNLFKNNTLGYLVYGLIFTLLVGCNKKPINSENEAKLHCLSSQNYCAITVENNQFPVLFNVQEVIPEEFFSIVIPSLSVEPTQAVNKNLSAITENKVEIIAINGYLEGVNMYMGKIPLFFKIKEGQFIADVVVGSCSEEEMKWRLSLLIKYQLNGRALEVMRNIEI